MHELLSAYAFRPPAIHPSTQRIRSVHLWRARVSAHGGTGPDPHEARRISEEKWRNGMFWNVLECSGMFWNVLSSENTLGPGPHEARNQSEAMRDALAPIEVYSTN